MPIRKFTFSQIAVLILVFLIGILVRLVDFDDPPLDFHPARQLHSALIARGFYLRSDGILPNEDVNYMHEAMMRGIHEPWIEPPIFEKLASLGYSIAGDADLRIPRGLAIFFWLLGGVGLVFLSAKTLAANAVIALCSFYLFLPYNILASRSFQPEPLMICLMIWGLNAFVNWYEAPSNRRAFIAGILIGLAILVKQTVIFPLAFAGFTLAVGDRSLKMTLKRRDFWLFCLLAAGPVAIYNIWGIWGSGFLKQQYQGRFFLAEIVNPAFYIRWIRMIDKVVGVPLFIVLIIGLFVLKNRRMRMMGLGFLAGYLVYGLVLPHHIGTHDYYQLPLMPLLSLGFGGVFETLFDLTNAPQKLIRLALALLCGWWVIDGVLTMNRHDYRQWPERWRTLTPVLEPYPGQINTIGIMDDYGAAMVYWGLKTPMIWDRTVEGLPDPEAESIIRSVMMNREYLMVTDLPGFYSQPKLQNWLRGSADLIESAPDYLLYRMKQDE